MELRAGVYDGSRVEQLSLSGDDVLLRVVDAGDLQVVEFRSEDREARRPGGISAALAGEGYPDPVALLEVATRHGLRLA